VIAKRLGIIGVGAIGGSIGMRARRNGAYVIGADCDHAVLDGARELGAIDAIAAAQELPSFVDAIVISAHLEATLEQIARLANAPATPALVVDVASVKLPIVRAARGLRHFVATHPMAGTQRSGVHGARADLFDGCPWVYVPSAEAGVDERACRFISSFGAIPTAMTAEEHDRAVALTSHLPQLVASAYVHLLRSAPSQTELPLGPVARELRRVSGMRFEMWREILRANAANVEPQLRRLALELEAAADALAHDDVAALAPLFSPYW
jgi:prephenate dehydrogenase